MLSKKDLEELIIKNSITEESMTPEQIKIRDNFHPVKVKLNKIIKMLEIKLVKMNTRPMMPDDGLIK